MRHEYYVSKLLKTLRPHHFHNKKQPRQASQYSCKQYILLPPVSSDSCGFYPVHSERRFRDVAPPAFPCVPSLSSPPAEPWEPVLPLLRTWSESHSDRGDRGKRRKRRWFFNYIIFCCESSWEQLETLSCRGFHLFVKVGKGFLLLTSLLSFSRALSCCRLVSSSWLMACLSISFSFSVSSRRWPQSRCSWLSLEAFRLVSSSSDLSPLTSAWRASSASELSVALVCSWAWGNHRGGPVMFKYV